MAESIPIETLKITISSSGAGQVRKNLEEIAAGLGEVKKAVGRGMGGLEKVVQNLKLLLEEVGHISEEKLDKLAKLGDAMAKVKAGVTGGASEKTYEKIAYGLSLISAAAGNIKNIENLERLATVLERLKAAGYVKLSLSGVKQTNAQADSIMDSGLGSATGGNAGGTSSKAAEREQKRKERERQKAIKEADSMLSSLKAKYFGWIKAIGRIALYRAIRSIIKGIMQSLNDGLDHFYQYSVKVNGLYATARAEIKTSLHYVSDALGAAAGQLIEKIYPVVVKLLDMTAEIFNYISEAIAFMSGEDTYTKAVRGLADANDEAKKLKATLLGFDEINKLNGNNGSGEDESGHFVEATVNKVRASATTGILAGIGAFFAGSTIANIINDINKLTTALGTKGLAEAAQKASEAFGTEGTGANGTGGSGLLGVLGRVAAGIGAVVALKFTDTSFESFLAADEADEKLQAGIQTALGSIGTVALAGMAGGAAGIMIAIPAMLAIAIQDVLVNDEAREKVDTALSGFNEWVTKVVTGEDEAGGGRGITSKIITSGWFRDLSRYSPTARKLLTDEIAKLTGTPAGEVTHLYRGSDGNFYTADQISTPTYTDTSPTVNVSLELDGEVVAKVVAKANNSYARRTLSAY